MDKYIFSFKRLITLLLPSFLRKEKQIAWLNAGSNFLKNIHDQFIAFGTDKRNEIKWTGQTISLTNLLVQTFGEGIFITNNLVEVDGVFVGAASDTDFFVGEVTDNTHFIGVLYRQNLVNFIVNVPATLPINQEKLIAIIDKYKLHGTTYIIVYF